MQLKKTISHLTLLFSYFLEDEEYVLNCSVIKNYLLTTPTLTKFDLSNI
jgi:hypothetical protein